MSASAAALALHAWAQAGLQATLAGGEAPQDASYGALVEMARLQARYEQPDAFGAHVQVEAASGTVQLLDASVRAGAKEGLFVEAGRMKTPVSLEYMVPAPRMILPTRALLVGLAETRSVGLRVGGTVAERLRLQVGAFDPVGGVPQAGVGMDLIGAADLELPADLELHLGGSAWLHPDDVATTLGESTPGWDARGDLALEYAHEGWTALVEGLVAHRLAGGLDYGAVLMGARRLPLGRSDFELEPALAGDLLQRDDATTLRETLAVNLHRDDWHLVESLSWEAQETLGETGVEHVARLSLQAGF